jgi:hypothetical protein
LTAEGSVIITMENKATKFRRAIVHSSAGDERFLIHANKSYKALYHQYPKISAVKFTKLKSDTDLWLKELVLMEERLVVSQYKFGIFQALEGQTVEDEFLANGNNFYFILFYFRISILQ